MEWMPSVFLGASPFLHVMENNNYITIQGWMINELKLKGNDLIVYALIFGFCQDKQTEFSGSLRYINSALSCSKNTSMKVLNRLTEDNLLIKRAEIINNVTFNRYKINYDRVVQKLNRGGAKVEPGGGAKVAPYNTNIDNNINNKNVQDLKSYTTERKILNKVAHLFDSKYFDTQSKKNKWLDEIRKLIELDKEKLEDIISVIIYARNDSFWKKNFLSVRGIREKNKSGVSKYDSMKASMMENTEKEDPFKNF